MTNKDSTRLPQSPGMGYPVTDFRRSVHCLLGVPVDAINKREAVRRISSASGAHPCFLSTPNLNFLIASQRDAAFRDSIIRSDLSVADGMPLVWIAGLLGLPVRQRVAGSDVFDSIMQGEGRAMKVFFFGGADGVAEAACDRLNALSSSAICVGYASPGFGSIEQMSDAETISAINRSGADFVVVALGARKGQAWIEHNRRALHAPVISHLGAVVNFVAGTLSRAPVAIQRLGLEWLWRIKEEPALWRRYARDSIVLLQLLTLRVLPAVIYRGMRSMRAGVEPAAASVGGNAGNMRLVLAGSWGAGDLPLLRESLERLTALPGNVELDLRELKRVNDEFIGLLMLLYGHQSKIGRALRVSPVRSSTQLEFRLCCAEFLLEGLVPPENLVRGTDGFGRILPLAETDK